MCGGLERQTTNHRHTCTFTVAFTCTLCSFLILSQAQKCMFAHHCTCYLLHVRFFSHRAFWRVRAGSPLHLQTQVYTNTKTNTDADKDSYRHMYEYQFHYSSTYGYNNMNFHLEYNASYRLSSHNITLRLCVAFTCVIALQ